ncbi:MAG: hypothetical protein ACJ8AO_12035 [Gemmatimonadaceae bacterium]
MVYENGGSGRTALRAALDAAGRSEALLPAATAAAAAVAEASDVEDAGALGARLALAAGEDAAWREALADLIGSAARWLAPDDEPPPTGGAAEAWRALVLAADRLYGSRVVSLGRLPFLTDSLLDRLAAEAAERRSGPPATGARATAGAGDLLARLAASRQLREAVSGAVGAPVEPTYGALYEYDAPGSRVRTHVDGAGWELVFHLVVAHDAPGGAGASELVAHLPEAGAVRVRVAPGEAVVLRGRGTLHGWAPLGDGERRTLIAVGFATEASGARGGAPPPGT